MKRRTRRPSWEARQQRPAETGSSGHPLGPHAAAQVEWDRRMKLALLQAMEQHRNNQEDQA